MATVDAFGGSVAGGVSGWSGASAGRAIRNQLRVLWALFVREVKRKYICKPSALLLEVAQPLIFMMLMRTGMQFLRGSESLPVIGGYSLLFLATGMLPVYCFKKAAAGGAQSFFVNRKLLQLHDIKPVDLFLVGSMIETLIYVFMMLALTVAFMLLEKMPLPQDLVMALVPFVINGFIGFGFAMFNTSVGTKYPVWPKIFNMLTSPLNIISGLFWTASSFPKMSWPYLDWNPFLHSTEWVRNYYYYDYTSEFLNGGFYLFFMMIVLTLGFAAERVFRRRLLQSVV